jgi:thioredoxin-like negative regulator of GroEL
MLTSQNPNPESRRTALLLRPFVAAWHWMFPPTQAHEDRQSHVGRIVGGSLILATAIGLMVVLVLNARPWYNKFESWQASRLVKEALELKANDKFVEAWLKAHEAYAKDPESVEVLRIMAHFYTMMQKQEASWFFGRLRDKDAMTEEDITFEIESLAAIAETKQAQDQIEEVLRTSKPTQKIVELADYVLRKNRRTGQLLEILKNYVTQDPENREIRLLLGKRLIEHGGPAEADEGVAVLWELAPGDDKLALSALEFLDRVKNNTDEDKRRLIELLEKHPDTEEEHRIAALRRLVELEPARKQEIILKAMADRKGAKREDLVPLARWLTMENENERLLEYLDEEMVRDYPPLLENYLNALTLLGRIDDLSKLVNDPRTHLTTATRAFHRAHLAYVTRKPTEEVNDLLVEALAAIQSEGRQPMLLTLADYAEKRNHYKVAEDAYKLASRSTRQDLAGYEGLLRLSYRNGNTRGYLDAATETIQRWPEKEMFRERYLYGALIAGIDMEQAIPQAQELLKARPTDSFRKLIVALGLVRQANYESAAKTLQQINLTDLSLGQGAVLCGIMQTAGYTEQARDIANKIPDETVMLPEEKRFLLLARDPPRS